jgi:hypothetical protein
MNTHMTTNRLNGNSDNVTCQKSLKRALMQNGKPERKGQSYSRLPIR